MVDVSKLHVVHYETQNQEWNTDAKEGKCFLAVPE